MTITKDLLKFMAAMVIFGTNGWVIAHIQLSTAEILFLRTILGAGFLLIVVLRAGGFCFSALRQDFVAATMGGLALGLNSMFLFEAYRVASVSLATLMYYCGPMFVLLASPILFHERLTWNKLVAAVAVACGMICITGSVDLQSSVGWGLLLAVAGGFFYAVMIVSNKAVKTMTGVQCTLYEIVVAFAVAVVYLVATRVPFPIVPAQEELLYIVILGLVNTGLVYYLYFSSLQTLPAHTVSLVCYLDPVTALFVSVAFLGETLLPVQFLGAVLVLGGACLGEWVFKR